MAKQKTGSIKAPEPKLSAELAQKPDQNSPRPPSRRASLIAGVIAVTCCLAVYLLRYDRVAGFMLDDAWYILLGKAVATGHGYTLMNSPTPGITPFYPPGFPFLLSLVFRVAPNFPNNLWLLKGVSIAAMFAMGAASYWYYTRYRKVSSLLASSMAGAVVLNPQLVFFATSTVMSECVFTLTQVLAVLATERCMALGRKQAAWYYAALASLLASFAFLTRSLGIGLIAAVVVYLAKVRLWRSALVFAAGVALLAGPWMLYSRLHTPNEAQRFEQGGYIVVPYSEQFWYKTAGDLHTPRVTAADLPERVWGNFWRLASEEIGVMFAPGLYRAAKFSGYDLGIIQSGPGILSLLLSGLILTGFIARARERITLAEVALPLSLSVIFLWPWPPLRLALPYLPFLIFYLVSGWQFIHRANQRLVQRLNAPAQARAALIVAGMVIAFYGYDHLSYIVAKLRGIPGNAPVRLSKYQESLAAMEWMSKMLPRDGSAVAATNPALVHLYTGFKTVSAENFKQKFEAWQKIPVRYIALFGTPFPVPPPGEDEKANWMIYPAQLTGKTGQVSFDARQPVNVLPLLEGEWNSRVLDTRPRAQRPWLQQAQQTK